MYANVALIAVHCITQNNNFIALAMYKNIDIIP